MNAAERLRVYGPPGYLDWCHAQPCRCCAAVPSECAHVAGPGTGSGMGRKADWTWTLPLCSRCHTLHHTGRLNVGKTYLRQCCAFTQAAWAEHVLSQTRPSFSDKKGVRSG